jgi:hypothetical protein
MPLSNLPEDSLQPSLSHLHVPVQGTGFFFQSPHGWAMDIYVPRVHAEWPSRIYVCSPGDKAELQEANLRNLGFELPRSPVTLAYHMGSLPPPSGVPCSHIGGVGYHGCTRSS